MPNVPITDHPLIGTTIVDHPMDTPYDPSTDTEGGTLIHGYGMDLIVRAVFHNWNGVEGLDMCAVYVPATGYNSHVSPREAGFSLLPVSWYLNEDGMPYDIYAPWQAMFPNDFPTEYSSEAEAKAAADTMFGVGA